jgi:hypothetical protein
VVRICSIHERENECTFVEGKSPLGRDGHRCEGNLRRDLKEVERKRVDWIDLAEDRDQ